MQFKLFGNDFRLHTGWCFITVAAMMILIKLAWWQLDRADEKSHQLEHLARLQQLGPADWRQLQQLSAEEADGLLFRAEGRWLEPYLWLLDNQLIQGRAGYDVVIPVQFADTAPLLLVNLGWIEAGSDRSLLPAPAIPEKIDVDGLLRTRLGGVLLGQNQEDNGSWPVRLQQIKPEELAAQLPVRLFPGMVYQQQGTVFVPHYQPVVLPPEKHRAYALQWFLLAVAVVGVAVAAGFRGEKEHE